MRRPTLLLTALAVSVLHACGEEPRGRLGDSCENDEDCESGLCIASVCVDPLGDEDLDGLTNELEVRLGSDPRSADSDGDGKADGGELGAVDSPADTDGDGRSDLIESDVADTDGDCLPDELDPHDGPGDADLSALVPKVCRTAGVCAAEDALGVRCPGPERAECVYDRVPDYEPDEQTCDQRDNDCDGMTDEGLTSGGTCRAPCEDGAACDDGDLCTRADACRAGACVGANPVLCDAADPCRAAATCDPATGECTGPPADDGAACDDGDACTLEDGCLAGACVGAAPVACTARDACHVAGTCDPTTGACDDPLAADGAACDDEDLCTRSDACREGVCVGADPLLCGPADPCHAAATCDPATGACSGPPAGDGAACDDSDACTLVDTCRAGACVGATPVECVPLDECHVVGVCDSATGACSDPPVPDGTPCDDGDACTLVDACREGACVPGEPQDCDDGNPCTSPVCDPARGCELRPLDLGRIPCGVGACARELDVCVDGQPQTCDPLAGALPEVCNGDDDDCDGDTDEEYVPTATSCGLGACAAIGVLRCVDGAPEDTCLPGTPSSDANCDDEDDDCDGVTDDDYVAETTSCGVGRCATTGATACVGGQEVDGCEAPCVPTGIFENPAASCAAILSAGDSVGDGVYWLREGEAPAYPVACDMSNDGGGWTLLFAGRNGSPNVFDHFDAPTYTGTFLDPARERFLRRAPPLLCERSTELRVTCGAARVSFAVTRPLCEWLVNGARSGWRPLTPTVLAGELTSVPDTVFTGESDIAQSFVFSRNQWSGGNTFASSRGDVRDYDYCANAADQSSPVQIAYREVAPAPVRNTEATAAPSCLAILLAGASHGDGTYWLQQKDGAPYLAFCDMTTDGGGWTVVFAGRNGSPNVFDHFDSPTYAGACPDPATHCLRRAPAAVGDASAEVMVTCGDSAVALALTESVRRWLVEGERVGWVPVSPRVIAGDFTVVPNQLYTGESNASPSFILTRNQWSGGNVFASSYETNDTFDWCANVRDQASLVRIAYREAVPPPERNAPEAAATSCAAILRAGRERGDGAYWLREPGGEPYLAYCDMTTDGGGWTVAFAGRNGSPNVFDHFDSPAYAGACPDPASRCLRRAPPSLDDSGAEVMVSCGGAAVSLAMTESVRGWLRAGERSDWVSVTPRVLAGTFVTAPNTLFTGVSDTNQSFILTRNQWSDGNVFASSYDVDARFDYCANVQDQASLVRIAYRELAPPPVRNTPETAGASCAALLRGDATSADGAYWLRETGGVPYLAYCDMTTDGGGWTVAFAGRNGSPNVFDHFDAPTYVGTCPDPASRCLRRAPAALGDSAAEVMVSCGDAAVGLAVTEPLRRWLVAGERAGWIAVTPRVLAGSFGMVPNRLFTGLSDTNQSFILTLNEWTGGNSFAASYASNDAYDWCANVADQAAMVRIAYRESAPAPIRNTTEDAAASCRAIRDTGQALGDGLYWLLQAGGQPYLAYCDMRTDGGGWTAVFAGRNGSPNVFDHFDGDLYAGACPDPASRCLVRAPADLVATASELLVTCGEAAVRFPLTPAAAAFLAEGRRSGWVPLVPTVLAGAFTNVPSTLWTGDSDASPGFVFSRNGWSGYDTFASSYSGNALFDHCANAPDQASLVRVSYR